MVIAIILTVLVFCAVVGAVVLDEWGPKR